MAKAKPKITAWSYSRLRDYKQCPQKAKFKYIDKLPEPGSPAMERGNEVHKMLEDYVQGKIAKLHADFTRHKKRLDGWRKAFIKGNIHIEQQWAFDKDWNGVDWFAPTAWCRVKMDLCEDKGKAIYGVDHKTGKFRPGEYNDQMQQYCAAMLLRFPEADEAHIELMFHDVEGSAKTFLKRAYLQQTLDKLNLMVTPMLNDTRFAPLPSKLCGWCAFSKKKGGPCKVA